MGIFHAQSVVLREEDGHGAQGVCCRAGGELRIALVSDLHLGYNVGAAQVQRVVED